MKFHKNTCSGSRVVPCERTDMTKLMIAIRNFVYAPKNSFFIWPYIADRGTPGSEDGFPSVPGGDGWGVRSTKASTAAHDVQCVFLPSFLGRSLGLTCPKVNALFSHSSNITFLGGCSLNRPQHAVMIGSFFLARVCPLLHHTLALISS